VSGSALVPTPQGQQETGLGTPGTTGAKYHFTPVLFCQLWDETFFQKYFLQSELLSYAKTVKKLCYQKHCLHSYKFTKLRLWWGLCPVP